MKRSTFVPANITHSTLLKCVLVLTLIFTVFCQWQSAALQYENSGDAQFYSESMDGDADYLIPSAPRLELQQSVFGPILFELAVRVSQPTTTTGNRDPPITL